MAKQLDEFVNQYKKPYNDLDIQMMFFFVLSVSKPIFRSMSHSII